MCQWVVIYCMLIVPLRCLDFICTYMQSNLAHKDIVSHIFDVPSLNVNETGERGWLFVNNDFILFLFMQIV